MMNFLRTSFNMRVFKVNEKTTTGCAIIYLKKIDKNIIDNLRKLSKFINLYLIFPRSTRIGYNAKKLSSICGATYYSLDLRKSEVSSIWDNMGYIDSITGYLSMFYIDSDFLGELDIEQYEEKINKLQYTGLETSVFKSFQISSEEIYNIVKRKSLKDYIPGNDDLYTTNDTNDKILYIKKVTYRYLSENLEKSYLDTFTSSTFSRFISSGIERYCPKQKINISVDEVSY